MMGCLWVALALTLVAQSPAPARPDFNGRWIAVSPKQVEGQTLHIVQDAVSLVMEVRTPKDAHTFHYYFDSKLHRSPTTKDAHGRIRLGAQWEKDTLTLIDVPNVLAQYPIRRAMSLTRNGELVLELKTPQSGPDGEGSTYSDAVLEARRAVFKRYN